MNISISTVLIIVAIVFVILCIVSAVLKKAKLLIVSIIASVLLGGGGAGIAAYTAPLRKIPQYIETYNSVSAEIKETGKISADSAKQIAELNENVVRVEKILDRFSGIDIDKYLEGTPLEGKNFNQYLNLKIDVDKVQKALDSGKDMDKVLPEVK